VDIRRDGQAELALMAAVLREEMVHCLQTVIKLDVSTVGRRQLVSL